MFVTTYMADMFSPEVVELHQMSFGFQRFTLTTNERSCLGFQTEQYE